MKGTYILLVKLPSKRNTRIGKQGVIKFDAGYYAYVGSAMNGLDARIGRHLRSDKKTHWHIDYLLRSARVSEVYFKNGNKKNQECNFAKMLDSHFKSVKNFGSTDCKCDSHLFYSKNYSELKDEVMRCGVNRYGRGT